MVDFGETDKIRKINENVDESNTYNGFSCNIPFFIKVFDLSTFPPIFIIHIYIYIYIYQDREK